MKYRLVVWRKQQMKKMCDKCEKKKMCNAFDKQRGLTCKDYKKKEIAKDV